MFVFCFSIHFWSIDSKINGISIFFITINEIYNPDTLDYTMYISTPLTFHKFYLF